MSTALLFSGQGSQYVGMGKDIADEYESAKGLFGRANEILGYDLTKIMFEGPDDVLRQTRFTQPALFLHEAVVLEATRVRKSMSAVAGHSLGEYSALYAAGVMSFEDALQLVQLRATLMYEAGDRVPGTMAAIIGLDDDAVRSICAELNNINGNVIVPANFNSPSQVVISGSADYVRQALPLFQERGAKLVKELHVSGAFHSPLLEEAQSGLAEKIHSTTFHHATVPVYVNVTGLAVTSAEELKDAAVRQLTSPVLWTSTMESMWGAGIQNFCEIGPGKVLQGLVKRTLSNAIIDGIDTAADIRRANQTGESV